MEEAVCTSSVKECDETSKFRMKSMLPGVYHALGSNCFDEAGDQLSLAIDCSPSTAKASSSCFGSAIVDAEGLCDPMHASHHCIDSASWPGHGLLIY